MDGLYEEAVDRSGDNDPLAGVGAGSMDEADPETMQAQPLASPLIVAESLPETSQMPRGNSSLGIEDSSLPAASRAATERQTLFPDGADLPEERQILSGNGDAEAERNAGLPNVADALKPAPGSLRKTPGVSSASLPPELAEEAGATASLPLDESGKQVDEEYQQLLLRGRSAEPGSGGDARRSALADTPRSDASPPRADTAVALASGPPPVIADKPGMNELPPEMRDLQLSPHAGHAAWGREMGERIGFLLHNNQRQAEIRLDPPHLGKLEIQLQVQDDKAMVQIHTHTAQTRDLIDASLLRLRDALQDAGYSQVDVQVSQREPSMGQGGAGADGGMPGHTPGDGLAEAEALPGGMSRREIELTARLQGRIDYFA